MLSTGNLKELFFGASCAEELFVMKKVNAKEQVRSIRIVWLLVISDSID